MLRQVCHYLVVDKGVKEFGDYGEKRDRAEFFGNLVSFALYSSIALVILSDSGYSSSSIALLNSVVRRGYRKGIRSLTMVGFMSYMSLALSLLIFFITSSTSSFVTCLSSNGGYVTLVSCVIHSSCRAGMVWLVLCPIVM